MDYKTLQKNSKQFLSVVGLSHRDFVALHRDFATTWDRLMEKSTIDGKPRQRKRSQRSDSVFSTTEDMLLYVVSYLKNNPTQEYHAAQWDMYQGQSHQYLLVGMDALRQTLMRTDMLPCRANHELLERLESMSREKRQSLCLDGTERPIERPQNRTKQKKQYSGKKKTHREESRHQ